MLTLVTDIGGELSNSYVDVAYADDYWMNHFSVSKAAQWFLLSDDAKSQLLIQACMVIETARFTVPTDMTAETRQVFDSNTNQILFVKGDITRPQRYGWNQRLQFPRTDTFLSSNGSLYIPEEIKAAQCEQAVYVLNLDESVVAASLQGIRSESAAVGALSTSTNYQSGGSLYSPIAKAFVTPYLLKGYSKLQRS